MEEIGRAGCHVFLIVQDHGMFGCFMSWQCTMSVAAAGVLKLGDDVLSTFSWFYSTRDGEMVNEDKGKGKGKMDDADEIDQ